MNEISTVFERLFQQHQDSLSWQPTSAQIEVFGELYQGIYEGNQRLNLTRITTTEDFWEKHLWDSFAAIAPEIILPLTTQSQRLIDVGTGGGFPGLPLAIAFPDWQITLLDSTRKKINFLSELSDQLQLKTIGISDRVESIGHHPEHRETYDLATIRAVGKAALCVEYLLPLLKIDGIAILYRGQWSDDETEQLQGAIAQCSGELIATHTFTTPITQSQRTCLYIQKKKQGDRQFPREIGIPKQFPLAPV